MTVDLIDIAKTILTRAEAISREDKALLEEGINKGETLVETLSFLYKSECPENVELLDPAIDEVFSDFHISTTLGMAQEFKAACVLLRTCVETSLYLLYFLDHPIEARLWADNQRDMNFSDILDQITGRGYLEAASNSSFIKKIDVPQIKKDLTRSYRLLSERVHGKYTFLQNTSGKEDNRVTAFSELLKTSARSIGLLAAARCPDYQEALRTIPALQRL